MKNEKYKGKYITVSEEKINDHLYERVSLMKGVKIIPYRDKRILLMNEKRTHEGGISRWKLVSGWVDKDGKSILEHAKDELAEEVSLEAADWSLIHSVDNDNFTINPAQYYFTCTNITNLKVPVLNPDSGCKVLGFEWYSFDEIFDMIDSGEILSEGGILVALSFLRKENKKTA